MSLLSTPIALEVLSSSGIDLRFLALGGLRSAHIRGASLLPPILLVLVASPILLLGLVFDVFSFLVAAHLFFNALQEHFWAFL